MNIWGDSKELQIPLFITADSLCACLLVFDFGTTTMTDNRIVWFFWNDNTTGDVTGLGNKRHRKGGKELKNGNYFYMKFGRELHNIKLLKIFHSTDNAKSKTYVLNLTYLKHY